MKRDLSSLSSHAHDLVIVGGGIFGVCLAWEGASRGLDIALVERGDFCQGTSANSFKIIHGGLRYLQHGDLPRIRESGDERRSLLRIAPHLARPLPIAVPTYRGLMRGRTALRAALAVYDLLTLDRNRGITEPANRIPRSRMLSRAECLDRFPLLDAAGLTGAAVFHDGQMYNPPRLALSFLRSAVEAGARAANYVEATGFLRRGKTITGIQAMDRESGDTLDIQAHLVINAAGSWAPSLLATLDDVVLEPRPTFSRDACFVVPRRLTGDCALAVPAATRDPDALLSRGARHLFLVPWRESTLVGVWHVVYAGHPDRFTVTESDLAGFLAEVNGGLPGLDLTVNDIALWNAGLVLFGDDQTGGADLSYGKRSLIVDHAARDGVGGLLTVIGVRYTTARGVAERTIDLATPRLGRPVSPSATALTPICGGRFDRFDDLRRKAAGRSDLAGLSARHIDALLHNHGDRYAEVLAHARDDPSLITPIGQATPLQVEVVHAVREEMAVHLGDVVFRRTDLGTGQDPGDAALRICAGLMARELGWSDDQLEEELAAVRPRFLRHVQDPGHARRDTT
ncbi:MAG: FAD-dependent oxidoreductase [Acidobacteriota bacterium]